MLSKKKVILWRFLSVRFLKKISQSPQLVTKANKLINDIQENKVSDASSVVPVQALAPGTSRKLSEAISAQVVELHGIGKTQSEIIDTLKIPGRTVARRKKKMFSHYCPP